MKLSVDYKNTKVDVVEMVFKQDGVIMTLDDGTSDFHKYKWLGKHRIVITNE